VPVLIDLEKLGFRLTPAAMKISPAANLTRKQLAEALRTTGVLPISSATLATRVSRGGGPPFRRWSSSRCLYRWGDALLWAAQQFSKARTSSSEKQQ
jgi:hypothetical protein